MLEMGNVAEQFLWDTTSLCRLFKKWSGLLTFGVRRLEEGPASLESWEMKREARNDFVRGVRTAP